MRILLPGCRVNVQRIRRTYVEVNSYSKSWPCLFPQHGPGKKHERRIRLETWQQLIADCRPTMLFAGLYHSDGCRFVNTGRGGWECPRYSFRNTSRDIIELFCDTCDRLGVHWTLSTPSETEVLTVYVSGKEHVAYLDSFLGPKS